MIWILTEIGNRRTLKGRLTIRLRATFLVPLNGPDIELDEPRGTAIPPVCRLH
jgi:hypothetical protein